MSYNKIILEGHLTRDIELRYSPNGTGIGATGIATTKKWKSQTGEQKEKTMFVDIVFYGKSSEIANQYLRKGSRVLIDGELDLDQWEDQNGNKRSKHKVTVQTFQMLDSKKGSQDNATGSNSQNNYQSNANTPIPQQNASQRQQSSIPDVDINDDAIPF